MPGTRTAPTVGALTVTENLVSLGLVDASGDKWSEAVDLPGGALADMAEIEAYAAAYQLNTNASLWRVTQQVIWEGAFDPNNAVAAFRATVAEGINLLYRDALLEAIDARVVAPVDTIMQGNQDIPLLVAPLTTLVTAYLAMQAAGVNLESMQFTGRRERRNNPRIAT